MSMQYASGAELVMPERAKSDAAARSVPYRPEIDGLRAISVLAVILFHAKVPGFTGGFVGVDVFFVISGYLITQILMTAPERGMAAQLHTFYVRRCRRILPALIVMLLVSTAIACWLFLPADLLQFGKDLSATALFAANVLAWYSGGYFDLQTPFAPLAHLWSIAVEEQFYVLFPLFLLTNRRARRRTLALIASAAVLSLALCVWASYDHPRANFFLTPTRAWELLLGSLVALGVGRSLSTLRMRGALAGAALVALLACVIGYDGGMRYPGLYAMVPCASAAIILLTADGLRSGVGRWMSAPALVFTGLISYSLYLWHLPLLAFASYYSVLPLTPGREAALLGAIYLIAAASWRYVEAPVRGRILLPIDSRFLKTACGATIAIALLGAGLWASRGLVGRLDEADATFIGAPSDRLRLDAMNCSLRSLNEVAAGSLCSYGPTSPSAAEVLVWGDSHALALLPAYQQIAAARNVHVRLATRSACRPLLDASSGAEAPVGRQRCREFNRALVDALDRINPALVIMAAYWTYPDVDVMPPEAARSGDAPFEAAFEHTLRAIRAPGRKICVIGDVPRQKHRMPYAFVAARRRGLDPASIAVSSEEADRQLHEVNGYFADLRQRDGFSFVDLKSALCAGSTCLLATPDGRSVYRDDNHLSPAGAELMRPSIEECFDAIDGPTSPRAIDRPAANVSP
jgi:peptidoglycan/LPS O-acetylase OafA/YrhL